MGTQPCRKVVVLNFIRVSMESEVEIPVMRILGASPKFNTPTSLVMVVCIIITHTDKDYLLIVIQDPSQT